MTEIIDDPRAREIKPKKSNAYIMLYACGISGVLFLVTGVVANNVAKEINESLNSIPSGSEFDRLYQKAEMFIGIADRCFGIFIVHVLFFIYLLVKGMSLSSSETKI